MARKTLLHLPPALHEFDGVADRVWADDHPHAINSVVPRHEFAAGAIISGGVGNFVHEGLEGEGAGGFGCAPGVGVVEPDHGGVGGIGGGGGLHAAIRVSGKKACNKKGTERETESARALTKTQLR